MNVLVACEESQEVCKAFRAKGHEAYSCDIQPCSGGHPEWHIQGDVLPILNPRIRYSYTGESGEWGIQFYTADHKRHYFEGKWDLIIAHPPCTYLTLAGNKWFKPEYKDRFPDRERERESMPWRFSCSLPTQIATV